MQLPITCLEFSAWIVTGAGSRRGAAHTLTSLYHFISTQDRGIIFVDEIEKLGSSDVESDWGKAVQLELFSVLDKRILAGVTDADDDQPRTVPFSIRAPHLERKFQASFFVVGAGAWQALWDRKIDIGFSADDRSRRTRLTYRELGKILRPEIRNRFNSSVLWLPPLTLSDYEILLREAIDRLPAEFTPIMTERAAETIVEAAETKKGFRWIQELVAFAVRELRARQATNLTSLLTS
jgi:hypothetical protein